jgi:hypothetical protein
VEAVVDRGPSTPEGPGDAKGGAVTGPEATTTADLTDRQLLEQIAETQAKLFNMLRGVMKRLRALEPLVPDEAAADGAND